MSDDANDSTSESSESPLAVYGLVAGITAVIAGAFWFALQPDRSENETFFALAICIILATK